MKKHSKLKALNRVLNLYTVFGLLLWVVAIVLILIPTFPYIWYRLDEGATETEVAAITELEIEEDAGGENTDPPEEEPEFEPPEFDPSLPKDNTLIMPAIGVDGYIHEGQNAEESLKNGIWRVPEYGTPETSNDSFPIIIAAHRFGYIWWSNDFRRTNSFYNLPKTKVGDKVEIVWGQRKYEYEIYKAEDATEVTDYEADLILYTCRMWNSPVRVFRYAERVR